jgi:hypothetical protein
MPTEYVPDDHNLLRHVKARLVRKDEETGAAIGFLPQAFELREADDYLSASWVQYFSGTLDEMIAAAVAEFGTVLTVRKRDLFALGVVGRIKAACASLGLKVRITWEGDDYPSHSAVRQFRSAMIALPFCHRASR